MSSLTVIQIPPATRCQISFVDAIMNVSWLLLGIVVLLSVVDPSQADTTDQARPGKITLSEEEWKTKLSEKEYSVCRQRGTEKVWLIKVRCSQNGYFCMDVQILQCISSACGCEELVIQKMAEVFLCYYSVV